jgi:predicted metalloprotease with PDZ domain
MKLNEVIAAAKDAGFDGVILEMIAHTYKLGAENEREACAKVCDDVTWEGPFKSAAVAMSNLIRARGEA